jgi:hypothetical protein
MLRILVTVGFPAEIATVATSCPEQTLTFFDQLDGGISPSAPNILWIAPYV